MEEAVIDTNVLVYDMIEDSVFHERAATLLNTLKRMIVPSVVLEEFILVLEQLRISRELIGKKIKEILRSQMVILPLEKSDFEVSLDTVLREKISFKKFNDKLILSTAKKMKLPIFTFDAELQKECEKYGLKILP